MLLYSGSVPEGTYPGVQTGPKGWTDNYMEYGMDGRGRICLAATNWVASHAEGRAASVGGDLVEEEVASRYRR